VAKTESPPQKRPKRMEIWAETDRIFEFPTGSADPLPECGLPCFKGEDGNHGKWSSKCTGNFYCGHIATLCFWAKVLQEKAAPFYVLLACVGVKWGPNENSSCLSSSNDSNHKILLIALVYPPCFFLGANCFQTCLSAREIFSTSVSFWSFVLE